jgi:opacity protein-like surface antigen
MKRISLTIICALFVVMSASAQGKVGFGLKAGMNTALEWTDDGTTATRFGFNGGVFVEIAIANKLDIQPELVYSMQGCDDASRVTNKFDYINLPIILKIYLNQGRSFSIDVGPQVGYLINAKTVQGGRTQDVYSDLNKLDVAICLGASYKITPHIYAGLRFNYSVTTLAEGSSLRNGVGQLGISYRF